jgi:hypothetical protein
LTRLEGWHQQLQLAGVIGHYERDPAPNVGMAPSDLLAQGRYMVMPPRLILDAYAEQRKKAAERQGRGKRRSKKA